MNALLEQPRVRTANVIAMSGIKKVYDTGKVRVEALKGVDLRIGAGEFVAIVGPSGSGKSTLMNLVGCLDTPTAGTYLLRDKEVAGLDKLGGSGIDHVFEILLLNEQLAIAPANLLHHVVEPVDQLANLVVVLLLNAKRVLVVKHDGARRACEFLNGA